MFVFFFPVQFFPQNQRNIYTEHSHETVLNQNEHIQSVLWVILANDFNVLGFVEPIREFHERTRERKVWNEQHLRINRCVPVIMDVLIVLNAMKRIT